MTRLLKKQSEISLDEKKTFSIQKLEEADQAYQQLVSSLGNMGEMCPKFVYQKYQDTFTKVKAIGDSIYELKQEIEDDN